MPNIHVEADLRKWLGDVCRQNKIAIQWVEPGPYGSSIGAPDAHLTFKGQSVSLELKRFKVTVAKGICCTLRPVQRRWHHVNYNNGTKCAVLAELDTEAVILIRGDHVPLRDYACYPNSGCEDGKLRWMPIVCGEQIADLFDSDAGFWK